MVMGVAGGQEKEEHAFLANQTLEFGFEKARGQAAHDRFISMGERFEIEE